MRLKRYWHNIVTLLGHKRGRIGSILLGSLLLLSIAGPMISPGSHELQNLYRTLEGPSIEHWLGTDQLGRDVFDRLAHGVRVTLKIGIESIGLALILGASVGILAGYLRGIFEYTLLRLTDVLLSIPGLILALVVAAIIGRGTTAVQIALVVRAFPAFARVTHSATRKVMGFEYIDAAIVVGATPIRIILKYILPNIVPAIIVLWPIQLGIGVLISASLSFFRLGVQPPTPELGLLINDGRRYIHLRPALLWLPGLILTATNIGLSLLSDGLRDVLDPLQRVEGIEE